MKKAFTLAEVLISIAIIGIVAALTIPTLVQKYKKKVVETKLLNFYSTMQQAIKLSEIENGRITNLMGHTCQVDDSEVPKCIDGTHLPYNWWVKYMADYIKVLKVEPRSCGPDGDTSINVYFQDGGKLIASSGGWNYCVEEVPDNKITPFGQKCFPFALSDRGLTLFEIRNDCVKGGRGVDCTRLIMENNWKIPDDYPYKF